MSHVVHNDDKSDWRLVVRESNRTGKSVIEAAKPIPYDGVLRRTTEERQYVSHRKNSTFNLSVSEVIERYEETTGADIKRCVMCKEWPTGAQEDENYLSRRFCSLPCEVKYDHVKADARDARAAERDVGLER